MSHAARALPPRHGHEARLWALVAVAFVADVVTTYAGLGAGLTESNPVARIALAYGPAGFIGLKVGCIGIGLALRPFLSQSYQRLVPIGLAGPWLAAALSNIVAIAGVSL